MMPSQSDCSLDCLRGVLDNGDAGGGEYFGGIQLTATGDVVSPGHFYVFFCLS